MGVAFSGLQHIKEDLFAMACSTAAKTTMTLGKMKREYTSLHDRCCRSIIKQLPYKAAIHYLEIPTTLKYDLFKRCK